MRHDHHKRVLLSRVKKRRAAYASRGCFDSSRYCVDCFLRRNHFDSPPSFALHSKTLPFAPNDTNADSPTLTLGASKLRGGSLQDINIAPGAQDQLTSWSKEWLAPTCELLLCHDIIYTSHILHCKNLCEVIVGHRRWSLFFKVGSDHRYRYLAVRSTPARVAGKFGRLRS